jgi:hypothetical protein
MAAMGSGAGTLGEGRPLLALAEDKHPVGVFGPGVSRNHSTWAFARRLPGRDGHGSEACAEQGRPLASNQ